jgi:hypothetical protein
LKVFYICVLIKTMNNYALPSKRRNQLKPFDSFTV